MKNKLRVFHSFWSKPLLHNRFGQPVDKQLISTLLFTAIGVVAAKRLDIEIVLHTDKYGFKLFEHLPYDDIYLTLEGHDINRHFWASGKMIALSKEPIASCHLDLDAWIKYPLCRDILLSSESDLVIQSIEDDGGTYKDIKNFVIHNINKPDFIDLDRANNFKAYNCGLVKINNSQLKERWLHAYWKIVRQLEEKRLFGDKEQYFTPDLIAEQWMIYQLCEQNGFCVETLCGGWGCPRASEIGYTHLISEQKYYIDNQLKDILSSLDEEIFLKTIKKIRTFISNL